MNYIRTYYNVPAKRGGRVKYFGSDGKPRLGTIKSAKHGYLRILLDGDRWPKSFHPTWQLVYLDADGKTLRDTRERAGKSA